MTARVVFDARPVGPRMHGIGRYAFRLLGELVRQSPHQLIALRSGPTLAERLPAVESVDTDIRSYSLSEVWRLPRLLARLDADLFFSPTFFAPPVGGPPHVMTIHDLTHLWRPATSWRYRAYYDLVVGPAARRARCVMTETRFTARRLIQRFGLRPGRVAVVPSGAGLDAPPPDVPRLVDTVVCVVNDKPHKNAIGALETARLLRARRPAARLVLIGGLPAALAERARSQPGVEWLPSVAEDELARRLAGATAFLFPSYSEGFGYPPLEAMASGTPVVASNASCIPEVLGDAALFGDPARPSELAALLADVLGDPALQADLRARGLARVAIYRWDEMGRRCADVIERGLRG